MISSDTRKDSQIRVYNRVDSAVFLKTTEEFGGLSNMAGGFPLVINNLRIFTSEALYQACRFPHMPEIQRLIIAQASPMTAKMKGKPYRRESRPDWNQVRVKIMRWCLRVKLAQNWTKFSELLLATGSRPIVESSRKDDFWGARPLDNGTLVGMNVLGRLLMELREEIRSGVCAAPMRVEPLQIPDFLLDGQPISTVVGSGEVEYRRSAQRQERRVMAPESRAMAVQVSLFDRALSSPHSEGQEPESERYPLIHSLKPYSTYKKSGVPWLGAVPAHWQMRRNGRLFAQRNETGFPDLPILEVSLKTGVRIRTFDESTRKQLMSDRGKYKRACRGDIAYNMMRMWQGAVGVPGTDGLVSPAYVVARPLQGTDARFFSFLFRTPGYMGEVNNFSRGIVSDRNRLYWEDFKQITSPYPPFEEQSAIVRFLDYADRSIQRYIRAKKKLIALLNEQKQAIIHRAVSRGLDPNVRLKPSGVEWLGEVPEHWTVSRVKHEFYCLNRRRIPLSGTDRGLMMLRLYDYYGASGVIDKVDDYLFDEELLLIAEDGANLVLRNLPLAIIARGKFWVNNHAHVLRPRRGNLEFLANLMESLSYLPWISGAAQPKLTQDRLLAIEIAVPPPEEQEEIMRWVNREIASLRAGITQAISEIDLLYEYRTRLIADVVTGKLNVREAAARLPEAEEPELLDEGVAMGEDEAAGEDLDDLPEDAVA